MQITQLVTLAETYSAHSGKKLSTLGVYIVNDGKFFTRLQNDAGCTLKTAHKVLRWFTENWPNDLAWPSSVARPQPSRRVA